MPPPAPLDAATATDLLRSATGTDHVLVGPLTGGMTGAHEIRHPDGTRLVLKWELDPGAQAGRRRGVGVNERLARDAGWPVPDETTVEADGVLLVVQQLLPGRTVERITHAIVDDVLALHPRRLGLGRPGEGSAWREEMKVTLTEGGRGYCIHASLRDHDDRTRRLLDAIVAIGTALDPTGLPAHDLLHADLHEGNLLEVDGRVAAVIDTDFSTIGDAAFDLVTMYVASLTAPCDTGVPERLRSVALDDLDPARRDVYLAHLLLRCIDWPIRRGEPAEVDRWLAVADQLLLDR